MAKLYFKYGAMKSGKTTDLIKTYYNYHEKGMNTLIIKPQADLKAGNNIITRSREELTVDKLFSKEENIYDWLTTYIEENNLYVRDDDYISYFQEENSTNRIEDLPYLIRHNYIKINIGCIFVDEAQFLEANQIDELSRIVHDYNIPVICYGLKIDAFTYLFPGSKRLFEIAEALEELKAVCMCGEKATMNLRYNIVDGIKIPVFSGEQVAIDGIDAEYDSVCLKCYRKIRSKRNE